MTDPAPERARRAAAGARPPGPRRPIWNPPPARLPDDRSPARPRLADDPAPTTALFRALSPRVPTIRSAGWIGLANSRPRGAAASRTSTLSATSTRRPVSVNGRAQRTLSGNSRDTLRTSRRRSNSAEEAACAWVSHGVEVLSVAGLARLRVEQSLQWQIS